MLIIPTKFEVDMSIRCRVTAFLSANRSRDLLTLTFDILTLNRCHTWRVTWPTPPINLKTPRLFILELRVITVPIDYHRKCVLGHCACTESRDPWVGGQKRLHIWNSRPRFAYSLYNFYWATTTIKGRLLSSVNNAKTLDCVLVRKCFVRDLVILTFDLLTLNSCHSWRVTWATSPPNMKTLRLSLLELRVITVPFD